MGRGAGILRAMEPVPEPAAETRTRRIPFASSLAGRMILYGVAPMVAVVIAMYVMGATTRYQALRDDAETRLRDGARLSAALVEDANNNAAALVEMLAEAQEAGLFGERRRTLALLAVMVQRTPWCEGAFVVYEEDADEGDATHAESGLPDAAAGPGGRFMPRWYRDRMQGGKVVLRPFNDPEQDQGFVAARRLVRESGRAALAVSDPQVRDGVALVRYEMPIVLDGRFLGAVGVDRSLRDLGELLAPVAERMDARVFVVTSRGQVVAECAPGKEAARSLETLTTGDGDGGYGPVFRALRMEGRETVLMRLPDPVSGEDSYFVASSVATGDWRLVLALPSAQVLGPLRREMMQIGTLALVCTSLVMVVVIVMSSRAARDVRGAVLLAGRVADGDLTAEVKVSPRAAAEARVLGEALCGMTRNLDRLVGGVKHAAIRMHSTATQVAATSREQEGAAQEFARSSSEIAAAVREITHTGDELVGSMRDVRGEAERTASMATSSRDSLERMEQSMRSLDKATAAVAERLATINEKATGITAIVETINRVAEQTNLLSVNAAIEAEKAGESGRGFLVVSREIRRLADQTGRSTVEIDRMVTQMQSAVSAGVMEMDRFADQVRRGVDEVDRIGGELSQVIGQVAAATKRFQSLDEGLAQQTEGARRIDEAMGRLAATASQTQNSMTEFAGAATALQEALASLRTVVGAFRLRS